ncbi:hypothetical protein QWZ13_12925 [Reinekea marina]|nr:hypothetical protein [Reinekea marina]MDN3649816.1 hypothetical protein [Reinekea marina]
MANIKKPIRILILSSIKSTKLKFISVQRFQIGNHALNSTH